MQTVLACPWHRCQPTDSFVAPVLGALGPCHQRRSAPHGAPRQLNLSSIGPRQRWGWPRPVRARPRRTPRRQLLRALARSKAPAEAPRRAHAVSARPRPARRQRGRFVRGPPARAAGDRGGLPRAAGARAGGEGGAVRGRARARRRAGRRARRGGTGGRARRRRRGRCRRAARGGRAAAHGVRWPLRGGAPAPRGVCRAGRWGVCAAQRCKVAGRQAGRQEPFPCIPRGHSGPPASAEHRQSAQAEALGRHAPPDVLAAAAAAHAAAAADAGAAAAAHEEPRPDAAAFSLAAEHILAAWQAPPPPPHPLQQAGGRRAPAGLGECAKGRYAGFDDPGEPCEARGAPAGAPAPAPAARADGLRFGVGECGSGGSGSGGSGPGRSGSGAPGCGSRGPPGGFNRRAPDAAVPALFANRVTGRRSALGVRCPACSLPACWPGRDLRAAVRWS